MYSVVGRLSGGKCRIALVYGVRSSFTRGRGSCTGYVSVGVDENIGLGRLVAVPFGLHGVFGRGGFSIVCCVSPGTSVCTTLKN